MTQDQQRRAAALYVTARGELSKKQCEQLAKEMDMKQRIVDRAIEAIRTALLVVLIGVSGAFLLAHWSVCEQDDRMCAFTGSES